MADGPTRRGTRGRLDVYAAPPYTGVMRHSIAQFFFHRLPDSWLLHCKASQLHFQAPLVSNEITPRFCSGMKLAKIDEPREMAAREGASTSCAQRI